MEEVAWLRPFLPSQGYLIWAGCLVHSAGVLKLLLRLSLVRHTVGLVHGCHVVAECNGLHSLVDTAAHSPPYLGSDCGALLSRWILGLLWRGAERQGVWTCYSNGGEGLPPAVQCAGLWAYPRLGPWVQSPIQNNRATKQGGNHLSEVLTSPPTHPIAQRSVLSQCWAHQTSQGRSPQAPTSSSLSAPLSASEPLPSHTLCPQSCSLQNSARVLAWSHHTCLRLQVNSERPLQPPNALSPFPPHSR